MRYIVKDKTYQHSHRRLSKHGLDSKIKSTCLVDGQALKAGVVFID